MLIPAMVALMAVTASVTTGVLTFIAPQSDGQFEKLAIGGYATVRAYHSDGTLFATWEGHNDLTSQAKNAIASCISGVSSSPAGFDGCKGWTGYILIDGPGFREFAKATNTLLPTGCKPAERVRSPIDDCTGWKTEATFEREIKSPVTITGLGAGINLATGRVPAPTGQFDTMAVNPGINLSPGDRLLVTITFNVS